MQDLKDYSTISSQAAISALTSSEQGLSEIEAGERLQSFGRNELPEAQRRSAIVLFLKQFKSVLVAVLFLAAILSWLTGHRTDAYIILIVVLIDSLIGFIQEWKAEQAVSALHKMLTPLAKVVREGQNA